MSSDCGEADQAILFKQVPGRPIVHGDVDNPVPSELLGSLSDGLEEQVHVACFSRILGRECLDCGVVELHTVAGFIVDDTVFGLSRGTSKMVASGSWSSFWSWYSDRNRCGGGCGSSLQRSCDSSINAGLDGFFVHRNKTLNPSGSSLIVRCRTS